MPKERILSAFERSFGKSVYSAEAILLAGRFSFVVCVSVRTFSPMPKVKLYAKEKRWRGYKSLVTGLTF